MVRAEEGGGGVGAPEAEEGNRVGRVRRAGLACESDLVTVLST